MATVDYFQRKLDDKRRLTIPAEVRNEFASGVVVTRGFGDYLHLYPKDVWDQTVEPALRGDILFLAHHLEPQFGARGGGIGGRHLRDVVGNTGELGQILETDGSVVRQVAEIGQRGRPGRAGH